MCEMMGVKSERPVPIEFVLEYASSLESFGVAGFGWGIAWRNKHGKISRYRNETNIEQDEDWRRILLGVTSTEFLVHLRRPTYMTKITMENTQPFLSEQSMIAFAHNGYFTSLEVVEKSFELENTSDSLVGFHYLLSLLEDDIVVREHSLPKLHAKLEGEANLALLFSDNDFYFYAGNRQNDLYSFQLNDCDFIATSLHSKDRFIFQEIFQSAVNIERISHGDVVTL